jgi:hypothetical protein
MTNTGTPSNQRAPARSIVTSIGSATRYLKPALNLGVPRGRWRADPAISVQVEASFHTSGHTSSPLGRRPAGGPGWSAPQPAAT